ncbi:kinase [Paraglaciecola sp.]|uniref:kinase n=1 Tax=Paraglaciecola sp. TaxID=1920173 RepID=UPI0030F4796B
MSLIEQFISKHRLSSGFELTAKQYYMPLAEKIALHQKEADSTYFVGLNGCQGSGKSTLADFLQACLSQQFNLKVVVLSLDDFYFDQRKRQSLAHTVHPLFATRGVPGTHDTTMIQQVLNGLKQKNTQIPIPRFDKSTDNPYPEAEWPIIQGPVDVVIFEGWCWGVEAQHPVDLFTTVNDLEASEDQFGLWRRHVNKQLINSYQPLYALMDCWLMFKAPDFSNVYTWRLEQEEKLIATSPKGQHSGLMTPSQIKRFIQFYQRLTEHGLRTLPDKCDEVFSLDATRKIVAHWVKANEQEALNAK